MLRKLVCAAVVLAVSFGVAVAEEFNGALTKIDGDKITVMKFKFKKGEKPKGEEVVLTLAKKVKVNEAKGKFNKEEKKFEVTVGDEIEGGLKNKRFENLGKGVGVRIITNDDNQVTDIQVFAAKKKKKKTDD